MQELKEGTDVFHLYSVFSKEHDGDFIHYLHSLKPFFFSIFVISAAILWLINLEVGKHTTAN